MDKSKLILSNREQAEMLSAKAVIVGAIKLGLPISIEYVNRYNVFAEKRRQEQRGDE